MTSESGKPKLDPGNDVTTGNQPADYTETRPSRWQEILSPDIVALVLQTLAVPGTSENAVTLNLTDEQKSQLIEQVGRKSDQEHSFKKWLLVSACIIFCFIILVVTGLIVFMVMQGETAVLAPILSGIGGAIAGAATGIGGTYWYVSRRG